MSISGGDFQTRNRGDMHSAIHNLLDEPRNARRAHALIILPFIVDFHPPCLSTCEWSSILTAAGRELT